MNGKMLSLDAPNAPWDERTLGDVLASHETTPEALVSAAETGRALIARLRRLLEEADDPCGSKRLLGVDELARRWRVDRKSVYGAIHRKELPAIKFGRRMYVPLQIVLRVERSGAVTRRGKRPIAPEEFHRVFHSAGEFFADRRRLSKARKLREEELAWLMREQAEEAAHESKEEVEVEVEGESEGESVDKGETASEPLRLPRLEKPTRRMKRRWKRKENLIRAQPQGSTVGALPRRHVETCNPERLLIARENAEETGEAEEWRWLRQKEQERTERAANFARNAAETLAARKSDDFVEKQRQAYRATGAAPSPGWEEEFGA